MAKGLDALMAGDGPAFLAVMEAATSDRERLLRVFGGRADDNRWDVRCGRAVLFAADFLLAQPAAQIDRFLPILAIAAAREHQYTAAAKRTAAEQLLARLPPVIAQSEFGADLVSRSSCHAWDTGEKAMSKDLFELVRGGALAKKTPYYREAAKHHVKAASRRPSRSRRAAKR